MAALLEVRDLAIRYDLDGGVRHAVNGTSFDVAAGESLGLVGESGCGKTTTVKALLRILPAQARVTAGVARLDGRDLLRLPEAAMRGVRWKDIALVPQSAMNALDPVYRIQDQIVEAIRLHEPASVAAAVERAADAFAFVGIDVKRLRAYPHELSGGMRQRACIAMALALRPRIVVADEPTTALDVLVKDQILDRIAALQRTFGIALLYVTHDISVVAETCTRVAVMYAGRIVEHGDVAEVFARPGHPYTMGLLNAFPTLDGAARLVSIPGAPPDLVDVPAGCAFAPRCPFGAAVCLVEAPALRDIGPGQAAACHFVERAETFRAEAADGATWQRAATVAA
jgi:peptide/nickel transport system ATP-binding protein